MPVLINKHLHSEEWFQQLPAKYREFYIYAYLQAKANGFWSPHKKYFEVDFPEYRIDLLEFLELVNKGEERIAVIRNNAWWIKAKYFQTFGEKFLPQVSAHRGAIQHLLNNEVTAAMLFDAGLKSRVAISYWAIEDYAALYPRKNPSVNSEVQSPPAPGIVDHGSSAPPPASSHALATNNKGGTFDKNGEPVTMLMPPNDSTSLSRAGVQLPGSREGYVMPIIVYFDDGKPLAKNINAFLRDDTYFAKFADTNALTPDDLKDIVQGFVRKLESSNYDKPLDEVYRYFSNSFLRRNDHAEPKVLTNKNPFPFTVKKTKYALLADANRALFGITDRNELERKLAEWEETFNIHGYSRRDFFANIVV